HFGRLLDRKVARLLAPKNAASVDTDLTIRVSKAASIAHQATGHSKGAKLLDRRHPVMQRQRTELLGPAAEKRIAAGDDQRGGAQLHDGFENCIKITLGGGMEYMELHPESVGGCLRVLHNGFCKGIGWVYE